MRTDPSLRHGQEGFTLVELLVVIVILGVLAAIALPQFLGQKDKAFRSAMKSDLRSVVLAQATLGTEGVQPTDDVDLLRSNGYVTTDGVSLPRVVTAGNTYVACVTHTSVNEWLVYNASTATFSTDSANCSP